MFYSPYSNRSTKRLVSFMLPYDSWARPLYYLPYLTHEIFHYVAPTNRAQRNCSFTIITVNELCVNLIFNSLERLKTENLKWADYRVHWADYRVRIFNEVQKQYASICKKAEDEATVLIGKESNLAIPSYLFQRALINVLSTDNYKIIAEIAQKVIHDSIQTLKKENMKWKLGAINEQI